MNRHILEVPVEKLRNTCNPNSLGFETTEDVPPNEGPVGQARAIAAIDFGLQIRTDGYNLFAAGLPGSGRFKTVRTHVEKMAAQQPTPSDWCYVHDFANPDNPMAISLPAGQGQELAKAMDQAMEAIKREVPLAFESESYEQRKAEVTKDIQTAREQLLTNLQQEARQRGFAIELTPMGIVTMPLVDGKPISREDFDQLPEERKNELLQIGKQLEADVEQALRTGKKLEKEAEEKVRELDREIAVAAIHPFLQEIRSRFGEHPKVADYLNKVQENIVENLDDFRSPEKATVQIPGLGAIRRDETFDRYKVNVFVNNSETKGAPIIHETNPTYYNLIGRIDYRARLGAMVTDFTMIKAGAIERANGGYLILDAREVLINPLSWEALKRALLSKEARVENIGEQFSFVPTATLKPEPIPLDVKVIMVGNPILYSALYSIDQDFRNLFKVKADFSTDVAWNQEHVQQYAEFISAQVRERNLKPFHKTGVARVVEYGSRLLEDQEKLSTRLSDIGDIVKEASFWAANDGSQYVDSKHVDKAIDERVYRSNMIEEKLQELIDNGTILIDTEGIAQGQVNGLSIMNIGDYYFGKPSRITATTSMGWGGPVNIERETKLSGRIHTKGFLILSSYLAHKFAQDKPLALNASIVFEQLYDEVDGDSASSTELYALLSSLSGVGLKQGIAVTGSVDQYGKVQAVGGVTRKIEGFFDTCKAKGFTGEQGVIIPRDNIRNLMLRPDVINAVREGLFRIYAIRTVEEGIEILTDMPAGKQRSDGTYPEGTINYLVDKRLRDFARGLKEFGKPAEEVRGAEQEGREAA